jgi:hypothetical protein
MYEFETDPRTTKNRKAMIHPKETTKRESRSQGFSRKGHRGAGAWKTKNRCSRLYCSTVTQINIETALPPTTNSVPERSPAFQTMSRKPFDVIFLIPGGKGKNSFSWKIQEQPSTP